MTLFLCIIGWVLAVFFFCLWRIFATRYNFFIEERETLPSIRLGGRLCPVEQIRCTWACGDTGSCYLKTKEVK